MNDLDDAFDRAMRLRDSNPSEAARLLRTLAERKDLDAAYNLGVLLRERTPHEAVMWFTVVANSGDTEAALNLGCLLMNSGHAENAARWLQYAARDTDVAIAGLAAYNLGELLLRQGRPVDAISWWRQAAESHHPEVAHLAAFQLGAAEKDRGNLAEAQRWWRYAAVRNDPAAAFNLSGMVNESAPEIPRWLLTAIRFGDRKLRFPAVHRLSRLISASDRQACLTKLARYSTQAQQAGRQGVAAEFMICRGILLRDGGNAVEAESSLRAAAQLCAESSDIEGEATARSELVVLLARPDPPAARRELLRITELGVELAALRGDHQTAGELNLALERLWNED